MMSKLPTKPTSITNETSMDRMRMKVFFSTMLDEEIDRLESFAVGYRVILSMILELNKEKRVRERERSVCAERRRNECNDAGRGFHLQ